MEEASGFLEDPAFKYVAQTELDNGYWVSTVYLGINHRFGDGPPLIYETMVFVGDTFRGVDCKRYSTQEESELGHHRLVTQWQDADPPTEDPI